MAQNAQIGQGREGIYVAKMKSRERKKNPKRSWEKRRSMGELLQGKLIRWRTKGFSVSKTKKKKRKKLNKKKKSSKKKPEVQKNDRRWDWGGKMQHPFIRE